MIQRDSLRNLILYFYFVYFRSCNVARAILKHFVKLYHSKSSTWEQGWENFYY